MKLDSIEIRYYNGNVYDVWRAGARVRMITVWQGAFDGDGSAITYYQEA